MRTEVMLRKSYMYAVLGAAVLLLAVSRPANVSAMTLLINVDETIAWATPSPFPGATLTASSLFETGTFVVGQFQQTGSFGRNSYSILFPPNPASPPSPVEIFLPAVQINWGDSIAWEFAGTMAAAVASFPTTACPSGPYPPNPCSMVDVGLDLFPGFAPIDISGSILTFDAGVPVGTWEIRVSEVPEPTSLMLVGVGLASLPALRRRRLAAHRDRPLRAGRATKAAA
jgi:PEP-CTERM motif